MLATNADQTMIIARIIAIPASFRGEGSGLFTSLSFTIFSWKCAISVKLEPPDPRLNRRLRGPAFFLDPFEDRLMLGPDRFRAPTFLLPLLEVRRRGRRLGTDGSVVTV